MNVLFQGNFKVILPSSQNRDDCENESDRGQDVDPDDQNSVISK